MPGCRPEKTHLLHRSIHRYIMTTPIDISEESGVRYLHFGSEWVQGAMRIRKPDALELDYTREMMAGLLLRDAPWPRRVLLIGLGAGSLTKFIHRCSPVLQAARRGRAARNRDWRRCRVYC